MYKDPIRIGKTDALYDNILKKGVLVNFYLNASLCVLPGREEEGSVYERIPKIME
jgi:hypothetical protein